MLLKNRTEYGQGPGDNPDKMERSSHAYIYALLAAILDRSGIFFAKNRPDMGVRKGISQVPGALRTGSDKSLDKRCLVGL